MTSETSISTLTFTGLFAGGATSSDIPNVVVEIYRVFPDLSDVSGPPTFSTPQVPTRVNSPSDVALLSRDSSLGQLNATTTSISPSFTANNSVLQQINPAPNQTTGGEGAITGEEVLFNVTLGAPIILPAGHYFFIPQVGINTVSAPTGEFYWLSAPKPIVVPGTPFPPGTADLQSWIRNENLAPDWLRVGKDIVGGNPAPAFNATFSLTGQTVPEPSSWGLVLAGACVAWMARRKRRA